MDLESGKFELLDRKADSFHGNFILHDPANHDGDFQISKSIIGGCITAKQILSRRRVVLTPPHEPHDTQYFFGFGMQIEGASESYRQYRFVAARSSALQRGSWGGPKWRRRLSRRS